jgi:hypothetical protein
VQIYGQTGIVEKLFYVQFCILDANLSICKARLRGYKPIFIVESKLQTIGKHL